MRHGEALRAAASELARVLADRDQCLNEIHEAVVQNIYATGLDLESARGRAASDAKLVERIIRRSIVQLNRVMRDLREHVAQGSHDLDRR